MAQLLQTHRDAVCRGLCADPQFILKSCGKVLLYDEVLHVMEQPTDLEKMEVLLDSIIEKGEPACETFTNILQQNPKRYPSLQQLLSPARGGMLADESSVISQRVVNNLETTSFDMKIQTVAHPGGASSGGGSRPGPCQGATHQALRNSVINMDRFENIKASEGVNFSICVTPSSDAQTSAGREEDAVDGASPLSQGPAVDFIRRHKTDLIECLRADLFILQYVDEKEIVSERKYSNLSALQQPEKTIIQLIDEVIRGGQKTCTQFLELLKVRKVAGDYPKLEKIMKTWCPGPEEETP